MDRTIETRLREAIAHDVLARLVEQNGTPRKRPPGVAPTADAGGTMFKNAPAPSPTTVTTTTTSTPPPAPQRPTSSMRNPGKPVTPLGQRPKAPSGGATSGGGTAPAGGTMTGTVTSKPAGTAQMSRPKPKLPMPPQRAAREEAARRGLPARPLVSTTPPPVAIGSRGPSKGTKKPTGASGRHI